MEDQKWDRDRWQGRSQEQVENNYIVMDLIFKIAAIGFFLWAFYSIAKNIIA